MGDALAIEVSRSLGAVTLPIPFIKVHISKRRLNMSSPEAKKKKFRNKTHLIYLIYVIPLVTYVIFIVTAYLIGNKYSCKPVANVYFWEGLISLPMLFAVPFIFASKLHILMRIFLAFSNIGLAFAVWDWAFSSAGMYFMCRLF